jgi:hypothetical protein
MCLRHLKGLEHDQATDRGRLLAKLRNGFEVRHNCCRLAAGMRSSEHATACERLQELMKVTVGCDIFHGDAQKTDTAFNATYTSASLYVKLHGRKIIAKHKQKYDLDLLDLDGLKEDGWLLDQSLVSLSGVLKQLNKAQLKENSKSSRTQAQRKKVVDAYDPYVKAVESWGGGEQMDDGVIGMHLEALRWSKKQVANWMVASAFAHLSEVKQNEELETSG